MFGYRVLDRFRDLEGAGQTGRKDAALLAAIAGFEALAFPTSRDQRQFSNLFLGLFPYVKDETRRMAAAALSRLIALPESIACHIADQPIRVAAPFLAFSSCVNDRMMLQAIARHGVSHARAISRRKNAFTDSDFGSCRTGRSGCPTIASRPRDNRGLKQVTGRRRMVLTISAKRRICAID